MRAQPRPSKKARQAARAKAIVSLMRDRELVEAGLPADRRVYANAAERAAFDTARRMLASAERFNASNVRGEGRDSVTFITGAKRITVAGKKKPVIVSWNVAPAKGATITVRSRRTGAIKQLQ